MSTGDLWAGATFPQMIHNASRVGPGYASEEVSKGRLYVTPISVTSSWVKRGFLTIIYRCSESCWPFARDISSMRGLASVLAN